MEITIYRLTLVVTGLANMGMAAILIRHLSRFAQYPTYRLTRILTAIWVMAFAVGYLVHAAFVWRFSWPTAASALTVSYFHIGALCFNWGYISLLDPSYLKKKVVVRDVLLFAACLVFYWAVALLWNNAPNFTLISYCGFFLYALYTILNFYRTYNRVSYRLMKMSLGNVSGFVRWMQVCCDYIVLFGVGSVAVTGIFPNELWPFVILLTAGVGMFAYMVYSLEKYGAVVDDATKATLNVAVSERQKKQESKRQKSGMGRGFQLLLLLLAVWAAMTLTSCQEERQGNAQQVEVDSLFNAAHRTHDYEQILLLADRFQQSGMLSGQKADYWRGYAYSRMRKVRLAENEWKKAVSMGIKSHDDLEYYSKSANRLAGLLYMKFDYEGTIRVAVPALNLLKEKDYTHNTDYANLHTFVGSCQTKLGNLREAAENYATAYTYYEELTEPGNDIDNFSSSIVGIINIVNVYIQAKHYSEAYEWTMRLDKMLQRYREHPQANDGFIDKQWARLHFYQGYALEGMGRKAEAAKAYDIARNTHYAMTGEGQIEATSYLISAHRWDEAADKFKLLEGILEKYDMKMTLDNIQTYLLPKFLANAGAHRTDSAIAVGNWICHVLDTAIVWERQNAALELATIYDMQQKEREIVEQRATLSHQRFRSTVITLVLVIVSFCVFIYFRHQSAMRLESAFHELEIANMRAEESSRIKSEFIQQISHEIRTPLNILSGYTQVITTPDIEIDEDTMKNINREITENTNRITGLVNKMLELSDARSQTVIERTDTLPAVQIAAEAVEASQIEETQYLTFDMQVSEQAEPVVLTTNHHAAVRALSLILDNARKFTAPAESRISHHPAAAPAEKQQHATLILQVTDGMLQFIVEDTGIGVPIDEADRIFEEFVQLDEYYDGTGIGLTVARSMARSLGGDIVLDTSYTNGARFVMSLPC